MIRITDRDFSVDEVIGTIDDPEIGAIITYVGTVRSSSEGKEVERIEFDADQDAVDKLRELEKKTLEKFDIADMMLIHRIGQLKVGDKILLVVVSAAHRQPAFAACMSIIDGIKTIHSGWAREVYHTS